MRAERGAARKGLVRKSSAPSWKTRTSLSCRSSRQHDHGMSAVAHGSAGGRGRRSRRGPQVESRTMTSGPKRPPGRAPGPRPAPPRRRNPSRWSRSFITRRRVSSSSTRRTSGNGETWALGRGCRGARRRRRAARRGGRGGGPARSAPDTRRGGSAGGRCETAAGALRAAPPPRTGRPHPHQLVDGRLAAPARARHRSPTSRIRACAASATCRRGARMMTRSTSGVTVSTSKIGEPPRSRSSPTRSSRPARYSGVPCGTHVASFRGPTRPRPPARGQSRRIRRWATTPRSEARDLVRSITDVPPGG